MRVLARIFFLCAIAEVVVSAYGAGHWVNRFCWRFLIFSHWRKEMSNVLNIPILESGTDIFFRNVGNRVPSDAVSYHRRKEAWDLCMFLMQRVVEVYFCIRTSPPARKYLCIVLKLFNRIEVRGYYVCFNVKCSVFFSRKCVSDDFQIRCFSFSV